MRPGWFFPPCCWWRGLFIHAENLRSRRCATPIQIQTQTPAGLRAAGAAVDTVTVYRNAPPQLDPQALRAPLVSGELHALTFTSPSTVRNFTALLDDEARAAAACCWIASIGPVTAEALRGEGLDPDVTPDRASAAELVAALADHAGRQRRGGR